jgi:hypothetical protein
MFLLLMACDPVTLDTPVKTVEETAVDSAPPEEIGGAKGKSACSSLYDQEVLQEFSIDIDEGEWNAVLADYAGGRKQYHPITFHWGDEEVPAHLRLKGNPNFSWLPKKMQFVISFNEDDPDARFHGVRKLALDHPWYEPTMLRDRVAWSLLSEHKTLPTACANNATLAVNGELYGLYTNIEYYDREWVERNFGDAFATGTLWKYGTEAKTNETNADYDIVRDYFNTSNVSRLEDLGSTDQWMRGWASEIVIGSDDGYWCCEHNFYLYDHPDEGLVFVPWDLDLTFDILAYNVDPLVGYGMTPSQFNAVTADDPEGFVDALEEMNQLLDVDEAIALIDAWSEQTEEAYLADPTRSTGVLEREQQLERMKAWVPARRGYLDSWIACERGESTDADGDGFGVCQDPRDDDPSVFPGATETCNGIDDDVNGAIDDIAACDDCQRHDFEDMHLLFCSWPRTWEDAQAACEDRGGTLATPNTTPGIYMTYLHTWQRATEWWLGGTDSAVDGTWVQADGSAVSGYWASGEPNGGTDQNCAAWMTSENRWRSEDCSEQKASICLLP